MATIRAQDLIVVRRSAMTGAKRNKWIVFGGMAAGAAAFYFLDREHGAKRRAAFATGAKRVGGDAADFASEAARDSWHRLAGVSRKLWHNVNREQPDDAVLAERIRSRMGRIVS